MKSYFLLQYKMTNRKLTEAGIPPALGYILGVLGILGLQEYAFYKTQFAQYAILLVALSFLMKLADKSRTEFLQTTFGSSKAFKLRAIENLIISLPFIASLFYHQAWLNGFILIIACLVLAGISLKSDLNFTIPTPFYQHPFEFTVGFRNTFYLFPIAYALTVIAISVGNVNLGIFAMLLVPLITLSYYTKPENEYYVWVHSSTPRAFLIKKLLVASKNLFLLSLPIIMSLVVFYWPQAHIILLFFLIGLLALYTIILAKYSAYPNEMSLPEGILISLCIYFPPFLLVLAPYFYVKSTRKLNTLLG